MPELTRDALFAALRRRRHYGTTGTRLFLDLKGSFAEPVTAFDEDPRVMRSHQQAVHEALMGDIIRPGPVPMQLAVEALGTAPIERIDVLHGKTVAQSVRPFSAADLGGRVRVLWQGAEYRGRGRETTWHGKLTLTGARFSRYAPVNFLNPERRIEELAEGRVLAWSSVTTGNLAGIDVWLDDAHSGTLELTTNIVSGSVNLERLADDTIVFDCGGLERRISVYRLPDRDWNRRAALTHNVTFAGGADLPVYVRVTQSDGHQAWSSPIYLIE
jgi:hypothetical protein